MFDKGAVIKQPDDESDTVFLIESGRAQCFYMTPQGSDAVLGELAAGRFRRRSRGAGRGRARRLL